MFFLARYWINGDVINKKKVTACKNYLRSLCSLLCSHKKLKKRHFIRFFKIFYFLFETIVFHMHFISYDISVYTIIFYLKLNAN